MERVVSSVKKIYGVASYTTWQFRREDRITGYHLSTDRFRKAAYGIISTSETISGTGTVIFSGGGKVLLLTCAHVADLPDTLIAWFEPSGGDPSRYVQSVSIREKQENWVKDMASCGPFTLLATDAEGDLAFLGRDCGTVADTVEVPPLRTGQASDLAWGSVVWIMGWPMGNLSITRGLVSPAAKRPNGEFSVDALLNKGYSGGVILAARSDLAGFELVGMVLTVHSDRETFLKPGSARLRAPDWIPYEGDAFIGQREDIRYGLNVVAPVETIRTFYRKHRMDLLRQGYNADRFFTITE